MVVTGVYVAGYVSMSRACTGHVQGVHNLLAALLLGCYSVKSKVVYRHLSPCDKVVTTLTNKVVTVMTQG